MEKAKIDRINQLGRLAKERELTPEEVAERSMLREEYMQHARAALWGTDGKPEKAENNT